jgi:hypothetical protein
MISEYGWSTELLAHFDSCLPRGYINVLEDEPNIEGENLVVVFSQGICLERPCYVMNLGRKELASLFYYKRVHICWFWYRRQQEQITWIISKLPLLLISLEG